MQPCDVGVHKTASRGLQVRQLHTLDTTKCKRLIGWAIIFVNFSSQRDSTNTLMSTTQ